MTAAGKGEGEGKSAARRQMERDGAERHARRALGGGGLLLLAGLAMVGAGPSDGGMGATLVALLVLIYGIHTFGRLGPEGADPLR